jgi:ABC-2 type transport system ATP-binding protein
MEIQISNVTKHFGKNRILEDITLKAAPGEILCLLGPSGAGKTTLIRLVIGAIRADAGMITIDGKPMPDMDLIRHIGYMPQNDAVYSDLSGWDNLMFFGSMYGMKMKKVRQRVEETLDLVDLANDRDKLVANYSGGMKKRLSLAIALLHDPEVVMLDEPTVGVDPVLRKAIWAEFDKLCGAGKTIIISTHVMDEAEKCHKAALLYQGRLLINDRIGALKAKTESGNLEDLFFSARKDGDIA